MSSLQPRRVTKWGIVLFSPKGPKPRNHSLSVELFEKKTIQTKICLEPSARGMEESGHG